MKKQEIHYMSHVELIVEKVTDNKIFIEQFSGNKIGCGSRGTVKEVQGNSVTVDLPFFNYIVRIFTTKDDLKLLPYD